MKTTSYRLLRLVMWLLLLPASTLRAQVDTTWMAELPVIELTYDTAAFSPEQYIPATFVYHSADSTCQLSCRIRHRGGTSLIYDKPNYAIKFIDEAGSPLDASFLGMRSDNNWILDAMASDYAKMRNRVAMDLWLNTSRAPYHQEAEPKAVNGYRGEYVEVYANGDYYGVFCLTERVDRKQLKLKKFRMNADSTGLEHRGLLYKAVDGYMTRTPYFLYQKNVPDDALSHYDGVRAAYPNVREGEPWSWTPLRNNIYYLADYGGATFMGGIGKRFDLPVFDDFILWRDLLYAYDNVGKNFYCWFYDQSSDDRRIGITPWDVDASCGRDVLGMRVPATSTVETPNNYEVCMSDEYAGYRDTLCVRYAQLRDSLWGEDELLSYFDTYFDLLRRTGAWQREVDRWQDSNCKVLDIDIEQQYIHQWLHDRLVFLDAYYGYAREPEVAISTVRDERDAGSVSVDLWGRVGVREASALPPAAGRGLVFYQGSFHIVH